MNETSYGVSVTQYYIVIDLKLNLKSLKSPLRLIGVFGKHIFVKLLLTLNSVDKLSVH